MDHRSPLNALPNDRSSRLRPGSLSCLRARVTEIKKDTTNSQPLFLFKVTPLTGGVSSGAIDNEIDNVVMLQPGFGSLDETTPPPSGIVFLPEVGSIVMIQWDGHRWCIMGGYSGPGRTSLETGSDDEGRVVSYNPGIETGLSRRESPAGWDLPHWSRGIEPGDALIGKGQARVKVTGQGVVIGSDLNALRLYTSDSKIIDRFGSYEARGVGYWAVHRSRISSPESIRNSTYNKSATTPPDSAVYRAELIEVGTRPDLLRPYILKQNGYVSREMINDGRSAMVTDVGARQAVSELAARNYVVHRLAVVQPLVAQDLRRSEDPGDELDTSAFEIHDQQVDADGSFRIRSGNSGQLVGAQGPQPSQQMDLSIDYSSPQQTLTIRIGLAGQPATVLTLQGKDPNSATATLETTNAVVKARDKVLIEAAKEVTVRAANIVLDGNTRVTGSLQVDKAANFSQEATIRGIDFTRHRHTDSQGGNTTVPQP